jgi:hypothetical protein
MSKVFIRKKKKRNNVQQKGKPKLKTTFTWGDRLVEIRSLHIQFSFPFCVGICKLEHFHYSTIRALDRRERYPNWIKIIKKEKEKHFKRENLKKKKIDMRVCESNRYSSQLRERPWDWTHEGWAPVPLTLHTKCVDTRRLKWQQKSWK